MPPPKFQRVSGDLNIVLTNKQITQVLKRVLGPTGSKLPNVALVSDHCCVDASVGSSVAGPVSGVASSVSVVGARGIQTAKTVRAKATAKEIKANIKVPKSVKVR